MSKTSIFVELKGKSFKLTFKELSEEIDIDALVVINISKIHFEVLTFPAVLAKFGALKADLNKEVALAKVNADKIEADVRKKLRSENLNKSRSEKMSIPEIDGEIDRHPLVLQFRKKYIEALSVYEKVDSIYWALKSKDDKLSSISGKITHGEIYDTIQDSDIKEFNDVKIRVIDN